MVTMNLRPQVAATLSTAPLSGSHASVSLTMPGGVTIVSQKWGSTTTNQAYGTGANPTDYAANVGGMLYASAVGSDGNVYRASGTITAASNSVPDRALAPTLASSSATSFLVTLSADPADGGSSITGRDFRWSDDDGATWTEQLDIVDQDEIVSGAGTFIGQARVGNAVGDGEWSLSSQPVTIGTVATAPAQMGAPSLNATATRITATRAVAPADGGSPINRYDLRWSLDDATWTVVQDIASVYQLNGRPPETLHYIQTRAVNIADTDPDNWSTSASITTLASTGTGAVTSLFITDIVADGSLSLTYSVDANVTIQAVCTDSPISPTAAQVLAGEDHTGSAAAFSFSDAWVTSGSDSQPAIPFGVVAGTYYVHVLPNSGGDGDVFTSNGFFLDTAYPVLTSAASNQAGDRIVLTFDKPLKETVTASDFSVSQDASAVGIVNIKITDEIIAISLGAVLTIGSTILCSYSGSTVVDTFDNPLQAFTDTAVTNAVTVFSETQVTSLSETYLRAREIIPNTYRSKLFFGAVRLTTEIRSLLMSTDGVNGSVACNYTTNNNLFGVRSKFYDTSGNNRTVSNETIPIGNRIHLVAATWIDATDRLQFVTSLMDLDAETPAWFVAGTNDTASNAGAFLQLADNLPHLLINSDGLSHQMAGQIWRLAMWVSDASAPIADITDTPTLELLGVDDSISNPALSRTSFGVPLFDFEGPAENWSAGIHAGSMPAFDRFGEEFV